MLLPKSEHDISDNTRHMKEIEKFENIFKLGKVTVCSIGKFLICTNNVKVPSLEPLRP